MRDDHDRMVRVDVPSPRMLVDWSSYLAFSLHKDAREGGYERVCVCGGRE